MSTKLDQLKIAFEDYILEIFESNGQDSDDNSDRTIQNAEQQIRNYINTAEATMTGHEISEQRASKLKRNLEVSALKEFSYKYTISKKCLEFIANNATDNSELMFDLISVPTNGSEDKKIGFALSFPENPSKYYQVLDTDDYIDISKDFKDYKDFFDREYKPVFDDAFAGNIFSGNENTKKVSIYYEKYFRSLCRKVIDSQDSKSVLTLTTGIVSFDMEDIIRGESRLSFFNMGQFTFYYSVESGALKAAGHGDVNPTYPPGPNIING